MRDMDQESLEEVTLAASIESRMADKPIYPDHIPGVSMPFPHESGVSGIYLDQEPTIKLEQKEPIIKLEQNQHGKDYDPAKHTSCLVTEGSIIGF